MIKAISFFILASAIVAGAEYCDRNTEHISFAGKLHDGQSMADFCECMRKHMIETGALNRTSEFSCTRNRDFSKLKWTKSDDKDESNVKDALGCTKCTADCFVTVGDNAEICDVIRNSNKELVTGAVKRVARMSVYYEFGMTITRERFSFGGYVYERVTISYHELLVITY